MEIRVLPKRKDIMNLTCLQSVCYWHSVIGLLAQCYWVTGTVRYWQCYWVTGTVLLGYWHSAMAQCYWVTGGVTGLLAQCVTGIVCYWQCVTGTVSYWHSQHLYLMTIACSDSACMGLAGAL